MSRHKIKYITYFDSQDSKVKRNYVTSASNKVEYIAKTIAALGHQVEIHSISEVTEDKFKFYPSEKKQISDRRGYPRLIIRLLIKFQRQILIQSGMVNRHKTPSLLVIGH